MSFSFRQSGKFSIVSIQARRVLSISFSRRRRLLQNCRISLLLAARKYPRVSPEVIEQIGEPARLSLMIAAVRSRSLIPSHAHISFEGFALLCPRPRIFEMPSFVIVSAASLLPFRLPLPKPFALRLHLVRVLLAPIPIIRPARLRRCVEFLLCCQLNQLLCTYYFSCTV